MLQSDAIAVRAHPERPGYHFGLLARRPHIFVKAIRPGSSGSRLGALRYLLCTQPRLYARGRCSSDNAGIIRAGRRKACLPSSTSCP